VKIKSAVILAAGLGTRLKEKTKHIPKGFLELEGKSLIQRSIETLLACGIGRIYIGTGYLSEVYEEFSQNYPQIKCIKSDKYETTSSMYTLYNMKESITEDFLLLESDLLYEKRAIQVLLKDKNEDIILASGKTNSGDEVYIEADKKHFLKNMSKKKEDLNNIFGELVGISKISLSRYKMMQSEFENQSNQKIDYEYIMVKTSKKKPFYVKKIDDLIWCEIDDENHLKRALNSILPKIKDKKDEN
jgi:2-aminoethylphosphonate-pyruvate transaminase